MKWEFATGGPVQTGIALMPEPSGVSDVGDALYFGSDDGFVYAVAAGNGSLIWKYNTASSSQVCDGLIATPVFGSGYPAYTNSTLLLFIGDTCGTMHCVIVNGQNAGTRWRVYHVSAPIISAVSYNFTLSSIVAVCGDSLVWFDWSGITPLQTLPAKLDSKVPPLVSPNGIIYVALLNVGVVAVSQYPTFAILFSVESGSPVIGGMALGADGTLYGNAQGALFAAYTSGPIAGKINWRSHFYDASTNVVLSNSTVIAGTWRNNAFGVCTQGACAGMLQWSAQLPQSTTAHLFNSGTASRDGGRLFVGSLDRSVYCLALV
jgi:outer membrane protein assembly factor BamB